MKIYTMQQWKLVAGKYVLVGTLLFSGTAVTHHELISQYKPPYKSAPQHSEMPFYGVRPAGNVTANVARMQVAVSSTAVAGPILTSITDWWKKN